MSERCAQAKTANQGPSIIVSRAPSFTVSTLNTAQWCLARLYRLLWVTIFLTRGYTLIWYDLRAQVA